MDSDDNIHHASNVDSWNEDYSGTDTDNDDYDGYEFENVSGEPKTFTVLKEEDIRKRQHDDIDRISSVLSVSRDSACILLRCYNWNVIKVEEEWFVDEDRVRNAVGLLEKQHVTYTTPRNQKVACEICFESYRIIDIIATACGHPFCGTCWKAYISISINDDGPGCLNLKCPTPSCRAAVGVDMVNMLASDEDMDKYHSYLLRSYVEDSTTIKWCPFPGCDYAVEYDDDGSGGSFDVTCLCSYSFCWNCREDTHRPVDCDTVEKWILKNSDESESTKWILVNSKPCPKCNRAIEKNNGCNHMTCRPPCRFQFCWRCVAEWSGHSACNEAAENEREKAKKYILRYTHLSERWSRKNALEDLHQMQTVHLKELSEKLHQPEIKLEFITEGWLQIVECRRVLKWINAFGYYVPEQEHAKRLLFKYLQGQAEAGLERLHRCAEKEVRNYLVDRPRNDFDSFRTKLTGLTYVTRNYFENLVRALENGLSEVDSQVVSSKIYAVHVPVTYHPRRGKSHPRRRKSHPRRGKSKS